MTIPSVPAGPAPGEVLPQQTAGSDEAVEALNNLLADHPMWVGDDGRPLEFHPLREERISRFIEDARPIFGALAARVRAEAVAATAGDREALGRIVRAEWVAWASEQADPKPSWLVPWEQLPEADREVDRRIGQRLYSVAVAEHQADLQHRIEVSTRYENDRRAALAERDEYHRNWQEAEKRTATAVAEAVAEERQRIIELVGDMCTYRDRDGQRLSRPHPASHLGHCPHGEIVQRLLAASSVPVATPTPSAPGHDAECENTPPKHGTHHCGCRRRRVLRTGPESAAGPSVGTGTPAETVESMCHWTQGRGAEVDIRYDAERAATHPVTCDCGNGDADWDGVGLSEAAAVLGVTKQRIHQLAVGPRFPAPVLRLKATPVWRRRDIAEFASRRRGPGRPPHHSGDGEQG